MAALDAINSILDTLSTWGFDLRRQFAQEWMGIAGWQYLLAFTVILLSLFARRLTKKLLHRFILPQLERYGANLAGQLTSALIQPITALLATIGVYIAMRILTIRVDETDPVLLSESFIVQTFQIATVTILIWTVMRLIDVVARYYRDRAQADEIPLEEPIIVLIQRAIKVFVLVVGGLIVVERMGYSIASLLGGLGIGGLAIALAAQDTLANIFGSLIVLTDRPFKIGDWVRIGDVEGFVEFIGMRSTRIRTWPKSLVTIPNKVMTNSNIENWSAMPLRRVSFTFHIGFDSPPDKVEQLVNDIEQLLIRHPGVDQGYHLVKFDSFSDKGLGIFIYYFTRSTVWKEHLQVKQEVNLEIMRLVRSLGLTFGMPFVRVYGHEGMPHVAEDGETGGGMDGGTSGGTNASH